MKRLEFPAFVWGEEFVYELLLKNVGALPIFVPWSPNIDLVRSAIYRDRPDLRRATISLEVYGPSGQRLGRLEMQHLAGATSELQTLQTLAPGQSAILRVRGRWRTPFGDDGIKILSQPEHEVALVATVILYEEGIVSRSESIGPVMILPLSR